MQAVETDYGKILKRIREELVLSQVELCKMLGSSFASVNRWEKERHTPRYKYRRKIKEICEKHNIEIEGTKHE